MTEKELTEKLKDLAWQMRDLVAEVNAFLPPEKKWELTTFPYDIEELRKTPHLSVIVWPDSVRVSLDSTKEVAEHNILETEYRKGE